MYQSIPYKQHCGSLQKEATNLETVAAASLGACAVQCTAEFKCKSFEYDHKQKICTTSARQLVVQTGLGEALACATTNKLITKDMKNPAVPDVFNKKGMSQVKKEVKKEAKKESKQVVDKAEKEVSQITTKVEEEKMKTKKVQAKEHVEEEDAVKQIDKVQQLQHKLDTASKVAEKKDDSSKKIKQLHLRLAESVKQTESIKSQLSNATAADAKSKIA